MTAVTAQDTNTVHAVHLLPPEFVRAQIAAALNDIGADAIKIGMLGTAAIAAAVADALRDTDLPLVLDPVLLSSSGAVLLDEEGITILKTRLIPRAMLLTPNLPEAEALTGILPKSDHTLRNAAQAFRVLGADNILFKGGHGTSDTVRDVLVIGDKQTSFESLRQQTRHTHGTGCTLATAIACALALGEVLPEAVRKAHAYVQHALRTAPGLGQGNGNGPLNHQI